MNLQTVGTENLPNVFIDKIYVYEYNQNSYRVVVTLKMYDHADSPSWRGRINDLNVKAFFAISDSEINDLNEGKISLYDFDGPLFNTIIRINDFRGDNTLINNDYYVFYYTVREMFFKDIENLNVYAACFVEIDPPIGIAYFDKFYGPMCGERIIVGGQINQESGYFYYPDTNEEYGGPVHSSTNMYMEGSEHTSRSHREVRYVAEENAKIIDGSISITDLPQQDADAEEMRDLIDDVGLNQRILPWRRASAGPIDDVNYEDVPNNPPTEIIEWKIQLH